MKDMNDLINILRKLHEVSPKEIERIIDCLYWEFGLNEFDESYFKGYEDGYREKEIETSEELDAMQ